MMTMVKGGTELLQDPVAQELLASRIPARLAYNWTDGTPRVVSIWFHWDGTDIVMATLPGAPKLKALQSGDRVALTIDTNDPPHHILSIRGTAEVTEVQGVVAEYGQAAVRYLGRERGEAYVGSLPADIRMGRIAVRPDQVVVLDFETRFPSPVTACGGRSRWPKATASPWRLLRAPTFSRYETYARIVVDGSAAP